VFDIGDKNVSVHISGGGQSAICLARCLEWYGPNRVSCVFANTNTEAPDLHKFLDAIEQRFEIKIDRLNNDGRNIWDVFDKSGVISIRTGMSACKASLELKHKPLAKYMLEKHDPAQTVIALGLSAFEPERQAKHHARLAPFEVIYPLNAAPRLSDCEVVEELEKYNLPVPDAYRKGYTHNNCGGGCVLAGVKQWAGLLKDYPERYAWHEERERQWRAKGRKFTVLRNHAGGKVSPYTLEQLRLDMEAGKPSPGDFRSGCGCMIVDGLKQRSIFEMLNE
jgi:3'-phosphoadenosine 5'-phosphosulfate sulfotransferase (PAPS reductase)/FAD synthetase